MASSAVPGGVLRVPSPRVPYGSTSAGRLTGCSRAALAVILSLLATSRDRLLLLAEPPNEDTAAGPSFDNGPTSEAGLAGGGPPPTPERQAGSAPPPAIVVVHRRPEGSDPMPPQRGRRRQAFGDDPLDERNTPRALRRAIDQLLGGIAERRDDDRDRDRGEDRP